MKKNLMSVLILALVFVNLVLTALIMFTIMPQTQQANSLITSVATALDLELSSGRAANLTSVKIEDMDVVTLDDSLTINLMNSDDGQEHYAIVSVGLVLDKTNEDYETKSPLVTERAALIKEEVKKIITKYKYEDIKNDMSEPAAEILAKVKGMFDSDFIIDVILNPTFG